MPQLDGSPSGVDASDAPPVTAPDASQSADAAPDVEVHVDPLRGIWRGVGDQGGGNTWTILLDLVDGEPKGPPGTVVGIITYPSISCGGTLVVSDAGLPDSGTPDGGGLSLTLHESVSATCITEGEDTFTLMPDGGLYFQYRETANDPVSAVGSLTRVDEIGSASAAFKGIWRNGDPNVNNLRPVLLTLTRDDKVGAASGTFLLAGPDQKAACAGHWTLAGKTGTSLTLTEVFNDDQAGCTGPGTAILETITAALTYTRAVDGGADNVDAAVLTKF